MNTRQTDPMWRLLTEYGNARAAQAISHNSSPTLDEPFTDESDRVNAAWESLWTEIENQRKNLAAAMESIERARTTFTELHGLLGAALEKVT